MISVVATIPLLLPFLDLGVGAAVNTSFSTLRTPDERNVALATLRAAILRLVAVAVAVSVGAISIASLDAWQHLLGFALTKTENWAASIALIAFAFSIPFSLGIRVLVARGLSVVAAVLPVGSSAAALALTLLLVQSNADPFWLAATSPVGGLVAALLSSTLAWMVVRGLFASRGQGSRQIAGDRRLLAGSTAAIIINIGLPLGLQSGRLLLAHFGERTEISEYSLGLQIYGIGWSVVSMMGLALWPIFVRRRSDDGLTRRVWVLATISLGSVGAVGALLLGVGLAPAIHLISDGRLPVSPWLGWAFGALLVAQAIHLPAGMMLTKPREMWWQAYCVMAMAISAVALSSLGAVGFGAAGVAGATAVAILVCQIGPDWIHGPRLLERRMAR